MSVTCRSLTQPPEQNRGVDSESHLAEEGSFSLSLSLLVCLFLKESRGKCFLGIAFYFSSAHSRALPSYFLFIYLFIYLFLKGENDVDLWRKSRSFFFLPLPQLSQGLSRRVSRKSFFFFFFFFPPTTGDAQISDLHGPPARSDDTHAEQMMFLCSGQAPHTCQIKFSFPVFPAFCCVRQCGRREERREERRAGEERRRGGERGRLAAGLPKLNGPPCA